MSEIHTKIQIITEKFKEHQNITEFRNDLLFFLSQMTEPDESCEPMTIGNIASDRLYLLLDAGTREKHIIETGFKDFDAEFGGLIKGEFVVIGGRPGMGKTQLVVSLCNKIANSGKPVAYISLELSQALVANRFIANISGVSTQKLLKGDLNGVGEIVKSSVMKLAGLPVYVYDQHQSSVFSIMERCRKLVADYKVEVVFIDYIQMVTAGHRKYNREAELAFITRELKKLAKELNIAIVITSQLSRQVEARPGGSKRPQLSDLRESGAIEQDADKVIFLYRAHYYGLEVDENNEPTQNVAELIVAKNKSGACETIKLRVEDNFTGFQNYMGPYPEFKISEDRMEDIF